MTSRADDLYLCEQAFIARGATKKPTNGRLPKLAEISLATFKALQIPCKPLTTLTFQALTVEAPALQSWLQGGSGEIAKVGEKEVQQSSVESSVDELTPAVAGTAGALAT